MAFMVMTRSLTSPLAKVRPTLVMSLVACPVGRVVQLQDDVAAGLNEFGLAGFAFGGLEARGIADKEFGRNLSSALRPFLGMKGTPGSASLSQREPGGRMKAMTWWTMARLPGRVSANWIHLSSVKPVGRIT